MYQVTYEMAEFLIRHLYEQTYGLRKIKDSNPEMVQHLFNLHVQLQDLLEQLEKDGHNVSFLKQEITEQIQRKYQYKELIVKVDGGVRDIDDKKKQSKGACGFILYGDGELLVQNAYYLGDNLILPKMPEEEGDHQVLPITVNMSEYMAVIKALDYLVTFQPAVESIIIKSDSEVVVNQINMLISTRVDNLVRLRYAAHSRIRKLGHNVEIRKIPREQNLDVDALVNQCLDKVEEQMKEGSDGS